MMSAEQEFLSAIYELASGEPRLVPFDEIAEEMHTTITAVRSLSALMRNRNLMIVTFGGVQLNAAGLAAARDARETA